MDSTEHQELGTTKLSILMSRTIQNMSYEDTMFMKQEREGKVFIVNLYTDDLIYTKNYESMFWDIQELNAKWFFNDWHG